MTQFTKEFDAYVFAKQPGYDERAFRRAFATAVPLRTVVVYCYDPRAVGIPAAVAREFGHDSQYFMMIVGVYATLGVFLLMAARNPQAHRTLIWFAVWSSVVHGAIMAVQSMPAEHRWHLMGDVPALFLVAIVLGGLLVMAGHGEGEDGVDTVPGPVAGRAAGPRSKGNDRAVLPAVTPYLRQRSWIGTPASACLSAQTPASSVKRGLQWTLLLGTAGQPRVKWALSQRGHAIEPLPFSCTMKLLRHKEEVSRVGFEPTTLCLKGCCSAFAKIECLQRFSLGANDFADARPSKVFTRDHAFSVLYRYKNRHPLTHRTDDLRPHLAKGRSARQRR
jgi:Family of unknown function (DUF6632)